ncbi:MAG: carbamoyltransferase HypF [Desulfovibrionaceae bacterium]
MTHDTLLRRRFTVTGQVQGVGFRPFVFRIALEHRLDGFVRNTPEGVVIEVQGPPRRVDAFGHDLEHALPPLAQIISCVATDLPPEQKGTAGSGFAILESTSGAGHQVLISPDTATCPDCLAEVFDPAGRRHLYPFTNCTNCGPRYTITRSIPYDRHTTSMACFPMCPACAAEYADPRDRRFHAQPNACPVCGPRLWLAASPGADAAPDVAATRPPERCDPTAALERAAALLAGGAVMAIKGLGGFHLACDATQDVAVATLRTRKNRHDKPLAVMVPDLDTARTLAALSPVEERWLSGIERPIVLCRARAANGLSPAIAPDTDFLGIMLPYTPLHHVLLHLLRAAAPQRPAALVMTSGNMSSEPICLGNREAVRRLAHIADWFLFHDRDILIRTDDSVVRVPPGANAPQFLRRARGFTPKPVFLAPLEGPEPPPVLGVGPELKNTVCVTKGAQAFVSQHIGDMENLETEAYHRSVTAHLTAILRTEPALVVRDLHPDYLSSRLAEEQRAVPVRALQHHFAHVHAVLAEHTHAGPALGLALDGTGYGEDGTLWGGECLYVDTQSLEQRRLARFSQAMLPGGEAAIREPWRIAQAYLWELGIREPNGRAWPWLDQFGAASRFLPQVLEKRINCPVTSSCGRLFDAVSALLGLKTAITYEGQAAIVLEKAQDMCAEGLYACPLRLDGALAVCDTRTLFAQAHADWERGEAVGVISRRFHLGLVQGLAAMAAHFADRLGTGVVGLSGGAMQNLTLAVELPNALRARGLTPLSHSQTPPNDGCISLGQAVWGRQMLALGRI